MISGFKRIIKIVACVCFCIAALRFPAAPAWADTQIDKVLTTTSTTPVALMDVSVITAATSTTGCSVGSYVWYDNTGAAASGQFGIENYKVELRIDALDGFFFSESVTCYLNNSAADFVRDTSGKSVTLTRTYTPAQWAPSVIKSPGSETVEPGGFASFVATATYVKEYSWSFISPDGSKTVSADKIASSFPTASSAGYDTQKMNVYGIPAEMDGWKVRCTFIGYGGSVNSGTASIKVKGAQPTPSPSPSPTPSPSPSPTAKPAADTPGAGEAHVHEYPDIWSYDSSSHWRQCECGEQTDMAAHSMVWTTVTEATKKQDGEEQGRCSVCGYTDTRAVAYAGSERSPLFAILLGVGGIIAVTLIIVIVQSAQERRYRNRRRRRRR